jgi:hypothetical protein
MFQVVCISSGRHRDIIGLEKLILTNKQKTKRTPWPESASEPYRPCALVGGDSAKFCG